MRSDPSTVVSRRTIIKTAGLAAAAAALGRPRSARADLSAEVLETRVISREPQYYCGWPTVARRANGRLIVVWSGGRQAHVCPFGRVDAMTSDDDGRTWTWPRVLLDGAIDDRDAGVVETAKGTLLVTTFTSLAYVPSLEKAEKAKNWAADHLEAWKSVHNRLTAEQRRAELGEWMLRSTDGGITWSERYPTIVNSPHGPFQLSDGRLLYAGKQLWTGEKRTGVAESTDDGKTWKWLSEIAARPGDNSAEYHELHGVQAADGRVIVQIRNHNKANAGETLQCESGDGGRTWSVPRSIGVWGLPSHLLRLRSGHLLMTCGYRRAPFGNQARVSTDNGKTWSEPLTVSADGANGDLGYPSTVELTDGSLLTVWYEQMKTSPKAVLRQARWKLRL